MPNIGPRKMFALVVDSVTNEPRRLIDTSDDPDDSFLLAAEKAMKPDETMHKLAIEDHPVRKPFVVAEAVLGYKQPVVEIKDPPEEVAARDQAVADISPLLAGLGQGFKNAFIAQAKLVFAGSKLPRNDASSRNLLANEMRRAGRDDIADKIRDGAPEAPFYVGAIVEDLLPQTEMIAAVAEAVKP